MKEFSYEAIVKDPAVFADNRLPAHADFVARADRGERIGGDTRLRQYLDGVWKFHYARNIHAAPEGFWAPDYDTDSWETIRVPAHIQMEGYDKPAYVNTQYPWDAAEALQPGQVPEFFNPVADYVTEFQLPFAWQGKTVNLCFEGVESGFALWLNGQYIGYSEDSFDPAEFALKEALRPGWNKLAVRVFKWTPGSWFEDQDFYRFSGIFRSVYLSYIPDLAVLELFDACRILVTPGMVELGAKQEALNFEFGRQAAKACDYIILAGFLPKIPTYLIDQFPNRIINIHPALLPKFGGKGMWGHHVHEAVKAAGETVSGITIHFVNPELDAGEHIAQFSVDLDPKDTPDDIAAKVHELEMKHYPLVIEQVIKNNIV